MVSRADEAGFDVLEHGVEGPFRNVPPQFGYWLGTRAKRGFGTQSSTWQNGLQAADKAS